MTASPVPCTDPIALNLWHPVHAVAELAPGQSKTTTLLGATLSYGLDGGSEPWAQVVAETPQMVRTCLRYGYIWATLGNPTQDVFDIDEADESDRRILNAGSIQVATSAPRAVENFLDMGHFPYVHAGLLGEEPHTEVLDYNVNIVDDEVWATDCVFYQPVAAASAEGGQMSDYTYRVPHPYCTLLYKTAPTDPSRRDVIAIFLQPMTEEKIKAHNFLCLVDDGSDDTTLKWFQQVIFSQDKPVLENQLPKRLPLSPRAETPIRADKTAIAYRRWLTEMGITYGVIPA